MERWALEGLAIALLRERQPDEAHLSQAIQELSETSGGTTERVMAEVSLHAGDLAAAEREAQAARVNAQTRGRRPDEVTVLELQMRILECAARAAEITPLADTAIRMAREMDYRTMLWRVRAAKSRALRALGRAEEAERERCAAVAIIWELADTIRDVRLRSGFLLDGAVSSVITGA